MLGSAPRSSTLRRAVKLEVANEMLRDWLAVTTYLFGMVQQSSTGSPAASSNTPTAPGALLSGAAVAVPLNAGTHLSGDEEVPPRDTLAQGQAIFQLNPAGTELSIG